MSDIGLVRTFCRELVSCNKIPRGPRPTVALTSELILHAMQHGGAADGRFASGYLFHTANITATIQGAKTCLDIGAAPGCQLIQLARLNPEIMFIGMDRNRILLDAGEKQARADGVHNITWINDDVTTMESLESNTVDAVISTMTLHDLADLGAVDSCLSSISRVISDTGRIYIEDYGRLKCEKSIDYFNATNAAIDGDSFAVLNEYSMKAAFSIAELRPLFNSSLPRATLFSTFLIPFLNVLKTPSRQIPQQKRTHLLQMRENMPSGIRKDLDNLRKFFRLGGWKTDPFA